MRKIFFSLMIFVFSSSAAFAQEASMGMRDLAVNQMFIYGQTLYERGDRIEAKKVFARLLQLDPNYGEAQRYAKTLGVVSTIKRVEQFVEKPIEKKVPQEEKVTQEAKEIQETPEVKTEQVPEIVVPVNNVEPLGIELESNQDLIEQITQEKQNIAQLSQEVSALSADTQVQSHE